jgi:hypothetical protein
MSVDPLERCSLFGEKKNTFGFFDPNFSSGIDDDSFGAESGESNG